MSVLVCFILLAMIFLVVNQLLIPNESFQQHCKCNPGTVGICQGKEPAVVCRPRPKPSTYIPIPEYIYHTIFPRPAPTPKPSPSPSIPQVYCNLNFLDNLSTLVEELKSIGKSQTKTHKIIVGDNLDVT